jgi:hypothetical protein
LPRQERIADIQRRRAAAKIPDEQRYRPKWMIALVFHTHCGVGVGGFGTGAPAGVGLGDRDRVPGCTVVVEVVATTSRMSGSLKPWRNWATCP